MAPVRTSVGGVTSRELRICHVLVDPAQLGRAARQSGWKDLPRVMWLRRAGGDWITLHLPSRNRRESP